jgi:AAA domain (dynein-related subfamily)
MSKIAVGEIPTVIQESYEASPKNCLMFWGSPGIGKTEAVLQAVGELKKKYGDFDVGIYITSQMESIDFSMPTIVTDVDGNKTYVKLPIKDFILKPNTRKIIFFDELPNAAGDVQKAAQSILTDRKIHETRLPDGVMIIAAGNRKEDRAGSNGLLSALANRLEHWECSAAFDDWEKWALSSNIHHTVISYLKTHPNNLNVFKADLNTNPTPRVWKRISNYMHFYDDNPNKLMRRRIESMVGSAIATEFQAFLRYFEKFPTKEQIAKDPANALLPKEGDIQYAITVAMLNWVTPKISGAFLEYLMRMNKEFQITYITQLKKQKLDCFIQQPLITKWRVENEAFLVETGMSQ